MKDQPNTPRRSRLYEAVTTSRRWAARVVLKAGDRPQADEAPEMPLSDELTAYLALQAAAARTLRAADLFEAEAARLNLITELTEQRDSLACEVCPCHGPDLSLSDQERADIQAELVELDRQIAELQRDDWLDSAAEQGCTYVSDLRRAEGIDEATGAGR